jgi:hypothetical protein
VTVAIKRGANVGSCVFRCTPLDAMSARIRRTRAIFVSQSLDSPTCGRSCHNSVRPHRHGGAECYRGFCLSHQISLPHRCLLLRLWCAAPQLSCGSLSNHRSQDCEATAEELHKSANDQQFVWSFSEKGSVTERAELYPSQMRIRSACRAVSKLSLQWGSPGAQRQNSRRSF